VSPFGTATSAGTAVLARPVPWTLEDASGFLRPPVTTEQLKRIVGQLPRLEPIGTRPTRGRPAVVYEAADLIELHDALRRWL